jgi:hypothetical protein
MTSHPSTHDPDPAGSPAGVGGAPGRVHEPHATTAGAVRPRDGARREVPQGVVIVADPGLPAELACRMEARLPWDVSVTCRRVPADDLGEIRVPSDLQIDEGEVAVILTDHPRRDVRRPIVAEVDPEASTGIVSLPSMGAIRLPERAAEAVERVVEELSGNGGGGALGPFRREDGPTVRFVTGGRHGRLRILAGMVRANRPWRLLPHLSKAFAAALAVLAYAILNSTIWQLGRSLGAWRMGLATLLAIASLVAWLIVDHGMWERPEGKDQRDLVVLFNAATVVTLLIGVIHLYVGLLAIGLVGDRIVLDDGVMSSATGGPLTLGEHLRVVWLVASLSTVAGALGTGFESDDAVRQAAFGFRQRERLDRDAQRRGAHERSASS